VCCCEDRCERLAVQLADEPHTLGCGALESRPRRAVPDDEQAKTWNGVACPHEGGEERVETFLGRKSTDVDGEHRATSKEIVAQLVASPVGTEPLCVHTSTPHDGERCHAALDQRIRNALRRGEDELASSIDPVDIHAH